MATKRQKKEKAKQQIRDVVPTFPIPRTAPPLLRALNLVSKGAEVGGQALVQLCQKTVSRFSVQSQKAHGSPRMRSVLSLASGVSAPWRHRPMAQCRTTFREHRHWHEIQRHRTRHLGSTPVADRNPATPQHARSCCLSSTFPNGLLSCCIT